MLVAEGNLESTQGGRMGLNAGGWGGGQLESGRGHGKQTKLVFWNWEAESRQGDLAHAHIQVIR